MAACNIYLKIEHPNGRFVWLAKEVNWQFCPKENDCLQIGGTPDNFEVSIEEVMWVSNGEIRFTATMEASVAPDDEDFFKWAIKVAISDGFVKRLQR